MKTIKVIGKIALLLFFTISIGIISMLVLTTLVVMIAGALISPGLKGNNSMFLWPEWITMTVITLTFILGFCTGIYLWKNLVWREIDKDVVIFIPDRTKVGSVNFYKGFP
jgi:hypothetical protein